ADLLHRISFIEKAGTGIKRMREAAREQGCPEPAFTEDGFFTAVFFPDPEVRTQIVAPPEEATAEVTPEVTTEVTVPGKYRGSTGEVPGKYRGSYCGSPPVARSHGGGDETTRDPGGSWTEARGPLSRSLSAAGPRARKH